MIIVFSTFHIKLLSVYCDLSVLFVGKMSNICVNTILDNYLTRSTKPLHCERRQYQTMLSFTWEVRRMSFSNWLQSLTFMNISYNNMAASPLASFFRSSDSVHDYACITCEKNGRNIEAKFCCTECTRVFCNDCKDDHDTAFPRHKVIGRIDVDKWIRPLNCSVHQGKALELFCEDHDTLCCITCISTNHG